MFFKATCFLLPDKIIYLVEFGNLFLQRDRIDRAVQSFKSALEQAKKVHPGQLKVAEILYNLALAVQRDGELDESLRYFQEAKRILDNHNEAGNLTSDGLNNIGICYVGLGELFLAFQSFKDALDSLDVTMISGERYNTLCENMAVVVLRLSMKSNVINQNSKFKRPLTEDTWPDIVHYLYQLSLPSKFHGEQDKVLEYLKEAREIAKRFDYKCGRVVLVLLLLSMTYGEMGVFDKSRSCYKEAKEMAKSLPPEDESILPGELGMIESMKKDCQRNCNIER